MRLTILGSGVSVPHPRRSSSGYWLQTPGGSALLDCSASAVHRMAEERLDWAGLDAVWISHFHLDHCGGLAPFLFGTKHAPQTQGRVKPLRIFGAKGLKRLIDAFDAANSYGLLKQPFPLEVIEVGNLEKFQLLPDAEATAMSTPHTEESHAIHVRDSGGRTMVYTSDTGYTALLATFARHVDLLLMECSFVRDKPVEIHLELAEAVDIVRRAEPFRTVLTHLYPVWDDADLASELARLSPGREIVEARDGMCIDIAGPA